MQALGEELKRLDLPHGGGILEGLGLHDSLHVGGPTVLRGDDAAWGGDHSVRDDDLLDLLVKDVLKESVNLFLWANDLLNGRIFYS